LPLILIVFIRVVDFCLFRFAATIVRGVFSLIEYQIVLFVQFDETEVSFYLKAAYHLMMIEWESLVIIDGLL
jgi:hypothetical protein